MSKQLKISKESIIVLTLLVIMYVLLFGIQIRIGTNVYGIINMKSYLKGSADLVLKCKNIQISNICIGKLEEIGAF